MKKYIDSYEKDLTNSTELVNEASKGEKLLKNKLNSIFTKYNLQSQVIDGKRKLNQLGKQEGDYNIRINVQPIKTGILGGASQELHIKVTDADTDEPIEGQQELVPIKIKSSWSVEKITEEINDVLADYRIKLTGSNTKIGDTNKDKGSNSSNNTKTDNSDKANNGSYAGFTVNQILDAFKNSNLSLNDQKKNLKALVSAWDNLNPDQQKAFRKLYDVE